MLVLVLNKLSLSLSLSLFLKISLYWLLLEMQTMSSSKSLEEFSFLIFPFFDLNIVRRFLSFLKCFYTWTITVISIKTRFLVQIFCSTSSIRVRMYSTLVLIYWRCIAFCYVKILALDLYVVGKLNGKLHFLCFFSLLGFWEYSWKVILDIDF